MTDQSSPVSESALSVLIKQYALDLRRNASGGDDYPYDFAKGVADYLGILIKRAKGDCACAQAGFPDSCDNCDGLAQQAKEPVAWRYQGRVGWGNVWRLSEVDPAKNEGFFESPESWIVQPLFAVTDTSTVGNSK